MIGRVALGGICASLAIAVAVRAQDELVQASAAVVGSCFLGYTATALVLERRRTSKYRTESAEAYLELLRQMNQRRLQSTPPVPRACRGCQHYHGRVYGGHQLICGMHPYGVEGDYCDDWQAEKEG